MSKTPNWADIVVVVLVVVILVAVVEVLIPRVSRIVLRRTPVVVSNKTTNTRYMKMLWWRTGFCTTHDLTAPLSSATQPPHRFLTESLLALNSRDHRNSGVRTGITPTRDLATNTIGQTRQLGLLPVRQ